MRTIAAPLATRVEPRTPMPSPASVASDHCDRADGTPALTRAISRGDRAAFAVFYERWFDRAYAAARSLTARDESFCLDVVQDAMLRAARRMPPMPDESALCRWLTRVVHSAALDRLRQEQRRLVRERGRAGTPGAPRPDELHDLRERIAWLRDRLSELPPDERTLLAARFAHARTLRDAGAESGLTGDAAHGRLRRIINRLRDTARENPR